MEENKVTVKFELYGTVGEDKPVLLASTEDDAVEGEHMHDVAIKSVEAMASEFLKIAAERDVQKLVDKL